MNTQSNFLLILICSFALSITACSEADKVPETLPQFVEDLSFPYIIDSTLFSFDPETGTSEAVTFDDDTDDEIDAITIKSNKQLITFLDTDRSRESKDGDVSFLFHTPLPEYAAYVNDNELHLYDFHTRHDHLLYAFAESNDETEPSEYICDMQKVITADEEFRLDSKTLLKNEEKLYIKTNFVAGDDEPDCNKPPFNFYQIDIEESNENSFQVRRTVLNEHIHVSKHEHVNEDDHDHAHDFEEGELDNNGNPFDPNNHEHDHTHTHEFLFSELDEHQHLSAIEIEEVHQQSENQQTAFEEHPVLFGRKRIIDEALMNSGRPVSDTAEKTFGYLGINTAENKLKFYNVNFETFVKTELWSMTLPTVDTDEQNQETANPLLSEQIEFKVTQDGILFTHQNKLIKLSMLSLFDDDQEALRELSFSQPIYTFEDFNSFSYYYDNEDDLIYIKDKLNLYRADSGNTSTAPALLKSFPPETVQDFSYFPTENRIIILKDLSPNDSSTICQGSDLCSVTAISQSTQAFGLESTIYPKSTNAHKFIPNLKNLDNDANFFAISSENKELQTMTAQTFDRNLNSIYNPELSNTIWAKTYDLRNRAERKLRLSILSSSIGKTTETYNQPALSEASLFIYSPETLLGSQGASLGTIPSDTAQIYNITIFNEYFAIVQLKEAINPSAPIKTYFFPPEISSVNLTGEFGDMKLMFETELEERPDLSKKLREQFGQAQQQDDKEIIVIKEK
jgi:hypothetical protein